MRSIIPMSEALLLGNIQVFSQKRGVLAIHWFNGARCSIPGTPDLWLVGPGGFLSVELKSLKGSLSLQQMRVARKFGEAGIPYQVWTPDHWYCGKIQREIEILSLPPCPSLAALAPAA